jgi:hypothetical protein
MSPCLGRNRPGTIVLIEPHRVTRVFFDGHDLAVGDQQRIAQAIEYSLPQADGEKAGRRIRGIGPWLVE